MEPFSACSFNLLYYFAVPSRPVEVCYTVEKTVSGGSFLLRLRWQVCIYSNLTYGCVKNTPCFRGEMLHCFRRDNLRSVFHPVLNRTGLSVTLEVVSLDIR